jgi:DNA (cytosine-5)-methyltransferase 1
MPKYVTYSNIRKILKIEVTKAEQIGLAYLTHYLQNNQNGVSHFFKRGAIAYSQDVLPSVVEEPYFQGLLPIKWDIPFPPKKDPKFKFIDLFAGIGGMRLAFQNLGGKCVFTSEWNYFAQKTYEANFGEVPFGDITKIDEKEIPDHDILLAGFPCQPFSIAGVSKKNSLGRAHGFEDETQGTLFFDIKRILAEKRPKAFLLENVKNLKSHDRGNTFRVIKETLESLDYSVHAEVLDGQHFVPQHRERIFIVGFDKRIYGDNIRFSFPELPPTDHQIGEILEENPDPKYTLTDRLWEYLQEYAKKHREKGNGFGFGLTPPDGVARTLSARYYKDGSEILIPQQRKNPRRLTPRECARLQGFPEEFLIPVSDNQAYRQFGNSVVVPLVQGVGKKIVNELKRLDGIRSVKGNSLCATG